MSSISSISSSLTGSIANTSMKRPAPADMFKKVDTDGNGGVSQSELDTMTAEMAALSGKQIDLSGVVTSYDLDGDTLLSQDEMGTMMMALKETMGPPPPGGAGVSAEQASASYLANGGDSSGAAGIGEKPAKPEEVFSSLDTNEDGVISEEELAVLFQDIATQTGQSLDTAEAIATYDEDGDGAISATEMDSMMQAMGDKLGPLPSESQATSALAKAAAAYQANAETTSETSLLDLLES